MAKEEKESIIYSFLKHANSDPTLLSFDFEINPRSILFCQDSVIEPGSILLWDKNSMLSDLSDKIGNVVSTPSILLNDLNEEVRANFLKTFIDGIKFIFNSDQTKSQQWRVQSIEGLDSALTPLLNYSDGYTGSNDDKISITCLDDVELTLYNLFELYRQAVYDPVYKRQLIPKNLLQFECKVKISDRRNLVRNKTKFTNLDLNIKDPLKDVSSNFSNLEQPQIEETKQPFNKPVICFTFCDCIFDLSSISKSFENINPGETDNNYAKYTFSFKYGKVYMDASYVDYRNKLNNASIFSLKAYEEENNFSKSHSADDNLGSIINKGVDGALKSAQKEAGEYIDNAVASGINKLNNLAKNIVGQEQGYEVGQNIYGQSNFISAFGKQVGDKLKDLADEGLNRLNEATIGKANSFLNTQKAKLQNIVSGNSIRGAAADTNPSYAKLKNDRVVIYEPTQHDENNTINTNIYDENAESKSSFEKINVYENVPSGPKQ